MAFFQRGKRFMAGYPQAPGGTGGQKEGEIGLKRLQRAFRQQCADGLFLYRHFDGAILASATSTVM